MENPGVVVVVVVGGSKLGAKFCPRGARRRRRRRRERERANFSATTALRARAKFISVAAFAAAAAAAAAATVAMEPACSTRTTYVLVLFLTRLHVSHTSLLLSNIITLQLVDKLLINRILHWGKVFSVDRYRTIETEAQSRGVKRNPWLM